MLLTLLLVIPLVIGTLVLVNPVRSLDKAFATFGHLSTTGLTILALYSFKTGTSHLQMEQIFPLSLGLGSGLFFAIDGISLPFVVIINFCMLIITIGLWKNYFKNNGKRLAALFFVQSFSLGCLLSVDLLVFYIALELLTLVILTLLLSIRSTFEWGRYKLILMQLCGSAMILLTIVCLSILNKIATGELSTNFRDIFRLELVFIEGRLLTTQSLLFLIFTLGLMMKSSFFPFHFWKSIFNKEFGLGGLLFCSVFISVIVYSMIRFPVQIFPQASAHLSFFFLFLASAHLIYNSIIIWAYRGYAEILNQIVLFNFGLMLFGIFLMNEITLLGVIGILSLHNLSVLALNICFQFSKKEKSTEALNDFRQSRFLNTIIFTVLLAIGFLPLSAGGIGVWLILMGTATYNIALLLPLGIGLFLYIGFLIKFLSSLVRGWGEIGHDKKLEIPWEKKIALVVLVLAIIGTLIFQKNQFEYIEKSIKNIYKPKEERVVKKDKLDSSFINRQSGLGFKTRKKDVYAKY